MKKDKIDRVLRTCKVLISDADGVLFDGKETRLADAEGRVSVIKTRDFRDGQGISFVRAMGILILFASGEDQPLGSIVEKWNEVPSVQDGTWAKIESFSGLLAKGGKRAKIESWLNENGLKWSDCVYIGDDLNDIEPGGQAKAFFVPADAQRVAKKRADWILTKCGGAGALRELAEMILDARGIDEATLLPA